MFQGLTYARFEVITLDAVGGTGAVALDLAIRSIGVKISAIARHTPGSSARPIEAAFTGLQRMLADRNWRRRGIQLADINPLRRVPSLTLGYVVLARPTAR